MCLVMFLDYFAVDSANVKAGTEEDELERVAATVSESASFAAKLESEVFQGPYKLPRWAARYRQLPKQLLELSHGLESQLNHYGKRGHKAELNANSWLVCAVEFAKFKIGRPCYEEIAEVFQAVEERPISEDFSGDAIRKKVQYIKNRYRAIHDASVQIMLNLVVVSAVIQHDREWLGKALKLLNRKSLTDLPSLLITMIGPPKDPGVSTRLGMEISQLLSTDCADPGQHLLPLIEERVRSASATRESLSDNPVDPSEIVG